MKTGARKKSAQNALQLLRASQWAITSEGLDTMVAIAERSNLSPEMLESQTGVPLDNTGERVTVRDGVATLSVRGPLFRYANLFTRISGATAYATLARDFHAAISDPSVKSIIMDIDSPGGEVNGCNELAGMIYEARGKKPITAYISGAGCSAAYWIASAADKIVASDTAIIGSIGCIFTFYDQRGWEKQNGIKRIEIVSSQSPKKSLDVTQDEGRAEVQALADQLAQVFIDSVARNRGVDADTVLENYGQGGVMVGEVAVTAGLADRLGNYETLHSEHQGDEVPTTETPMENLMKDKTATAPAAETQPTTDTPDPATTDSATAAADAAVAAAAAADSAPGSPESGSASTPAIDAVTAERTRITGIQALGRPGEEAVIAECVADPNCSVADAAFRLRSAEKSAGNSRLAALAGDEANTSAPRPLSPDATDQSSPRAVAASVLEVHARVTTPNRSR